MKLEGISKKAEVGSAEVLVEIARNNWGGWSIFPINQNARRLGSCECGDRKHETAPVVVEVDHGGIDVYPIAKAVCEDLRGVGDPFWAGVRGYPDSDAGGCRDCAIGNWPTYANAFRRATQNGWIIRSGSSHEDPIREDPTRSNRDPLVGFAVGFCTMSAFWAVVLWLLGRAFFGGGR